MIQDTPHVITTMLVYPYIPFNIPEERYKATPGRMPIFHGPCVQFGALQLVK